MKDVFILTKTPGSISAGLFLELLRRSKDPRLYLLGDGVYHLLNGRVLRGGQEVEVYASKEDIAARGLSPKAAAQVLQEKDLYTLLVEDVMAARRVYSF